MLLKSRTSATRIHEGSVCRIRAKGAKFDGALCVLRTFDPTTGLWRVDIGETAALRDFGETSELVHESALALEFVLLPRGLEGAVCHPAVTAEDAQGTCGRGLIVSDHVPRGCPLFEEPPFVVVRRDEQSVEQHHGTRWRAYEELSARALGDVANGPWATALKQLNDLGIVSEEIGHVRDGAERIVGGSNAPFPACLPFATAVARAARVEEVRAVLLRFHCNQFLFDNGAEKTSPFHANALYAFAARANHACDPTIVFVSEAKILAKRGQDPSTGQGLVRAFAKRDLLPGEKLTHAYLAMPREWTYLQRRAALRENYGFVCGCDLCLREEAADMAVKGGTAATALVEQMPGTAPRVQISQRGAHVGSGAPGGAVVGSGAPGSSVVGRVAPGSAMAVPVNVAAAAACEPPKESIAIGRAAGAPGPEEPATPKHASAHPGAGSLPTCTSGPEEPATPKRRPSVPPPMPQTAGASGPETHLHIHTSGPETAPPPTRRPSVPPPMPARAKAEAEAKAKAETEAKAKEEAEAKAKAEAEAKAKAEAEAKAKAEAVTGAAVKAKADTEAVAEAVAEAVPDEPAAKMAGASVNEEKRREETTVNEEKRREEMRDEGRMLLPRAAAQPRGAPSPWVGRALELLEDASAQTGVAKTTLAAAIVGGAVAGTALVLGSLFRRK